MRRSGPLLWVAIFLGVWTSSLAGVRELRLPVPTRETIALVAREMGAATYEESLEVEDSQPAASAPARRVQRKLVTGGEDIDDNAEYQEYQGVMGRPGVDFPVLPSIPTTSFSCRSVRRHGYFADLDTDCQVFHICDGGRKISFLCPNGTIFRQSHLICDWWFRVDCGKSVELYEESAEQLAADQRIYRQRAEAISKAIDKADEYQSPSSTPLPPSASPDTHIDAPAFETAKLNYVNRQNFRKKSTSRRRQQRPQSETLQVDHTKSSEKPQANRPVDEEKEQQVLSETASFASGRGNRFGQQFIQAPTFTDNTQSNQNTFLSKNSGPKETEQITFVTETPTSGIPTPSTIQTPTFGDYVSSTQTTRTSSQRNYRGGGRSQLPTSSQNNNFRPSSSRNNVFKNNRQPVDSQREEPKQQQIQQRNYTTFNRQQYSELSQTNSQPLTQSLQNNFARPSPDLEPPNSIPSLNKKNTPSSSTKNADSEPINVQNNRNYVQINRNRSFPSSTVQPSTFQPEVVSEQIFKQRRFTSTTEKPVFTVKFKPSKSFSYVELERTRTSPDSTSNTPQYSTSQPQVFSSISQQYENSNDYIRSSTFSPLTSSLYSSSHIPANFQSTEQIKNKFVYDQIVVTDDSVTQNQRESGWTPSQSTGNGVSFYSSSPTPSYSPTIPDTKPKDQIVSKLPTSTPFLIISKDESPAKLPNFRNIDPAEINLLPFKQKTKSRPDLKIPESSGPNALHTLALYYATSESDLATTPSYAFKETTLPELTIAEDLSQNANQQTHNKVSDEILLRSHSGSPDGETEIDDVQSSVEPSGTVKDLPTVLTKTTKDSFAFLFNETNSETSKLHKENNPCNGDDVYDLDAAKEFVTERELGIKDDIKNDLDSEQSRGIVQPTPTTLRPTTLAFPALEELPDELKLRDSTDLRELAQVFSRALSAYLENPDSFRRILSEVRPTEPTNSNAYGTTVSLEENEDEVLDFSDASNGPSLPNNVNLITNQKDSINHIDIEQINDLAQTENTTFPSELSRDLTAPREEYFPTFDSQRYSTENAVSLASDINLLSRDANNSVSDIEEERTFSPTTTAGIEDRRPRYGGFHNNSAGSNYKPYGSEVPEEITGKPLIETTYVTDYPTSVTITDDSEEIGFISSNGFVKESNQIEIESIPDKLGIVPAEDINSLADSHKDCDDSQHNHDENSNGEFTTGKQINIEDEIYDNKSDPEKLLITSGSQSFVSRDNYVRFLAAKQTIDSKISDKKSQVTKSIHERPETGNAGSDVFPTSQQNRGSVKYGPSIISSDSQNLRRKPHKELTFQNINLGNGVTLERTKTIRYSTPELKELPSPSTASPFVNEESSPVTKDPLSMLTDISATTEYPLGSLQSTVNIIRATTYHPNSGENPELPEIITRRGSLHNSWQWNAQPLNDLTKTHIQDNNQLNPPLQNQPETNSFSNFASTRELPSNFTTENEEQEMFERKAEEIFGNLNDTSADMLMNVMNQAESNMTVRRLVLLLVADRNGKDSKSLEESRAQLIQALLKTSEPTPTDSLVRERIEPRSRGRALSVDSTSTIPSITSTSGDRSSPTTHQVDTEPPHNNRPEAQYLRSPNLFPQNPSASSFGADPDARAVELLKSLYNLAARWG